MAERILIVEDQPRLRIAMREFLESKGFDVEDVESCAAAEEAFRASRPDAALLDYELPDGDALELLPKLRAIDENVPLLLLTGHGTIELAVRAMKEGAEQFLTKPVELPTLLVIIRRLLDTGRMRHNDNASRRANRRQATDPFAGRSEAIRRLQDEAVAVAESDAAVLIEGETGSGKGVLARWLHQNGPRRAEPFVDINCAGLSREFLESELFGHERGAFTGAAAAKSGLLEVGHRGTVFLDEIGDMDPAVQPKVLKVLEEKRLRRLGAVRDRQVDIRLVAATHHDLAALQRDGRFRSDLYYRLNTISLYVPPLRQRAEDIPILARDLVSGMAADLGRGEVEIAPAALDALAAHPWPGNVRELKNVLERALLLSRGASRIEEAHLILRPPARVEGGFAPTLSLEEVEQRHIRIVLSHNDGNVERAASVLGLSRSSLYEKIRRYNLTPARRS
ncbi:MAG TPA: sigma-54 dependent transcriptional regulator [Thermoanaerobaculia bacterium]|nr:sigma-54 dependent transcriptional regulator [Thermoanaerobaculia bacterium]